MKNTEVEKIHYWLALVGQLGWSKNSRSHFKNILGCSFPNTLFIFIRTMFFRLSLGKEIEITTDN